MGNETPTYQGGMVPVQGYVSTVCHGHTCPPRLQGRQRRRAAEASLLGPSSLLEKRFHQTCAIPSGTAQLSQQGRHPFSSSVSQDNHVLASSCPADTDLCHQGPQACWWGGVEAERVLFVQTKTNQQPTDHKCCRALYFLGWAGKSSEWRTLGCF